MVLPFYRLASCNRTTSSGKEWAILGIAGPQLVLQTSTGVSSIWPTSETIDNGATQDDLGEEPPGKRIKLSSATQLKSNFSVLRITKDTRHLVAVTAEDKCIRVFNVDTDWRLQQLTERCMSRRPCAIAMTADESTILCADKFGDVYSMPLVPSPEGSIREVQENRPAPKKYVPAASTATVHSGRNRKTLEEQLKQAEKKCLQVKDIPTFKHDLQLGHVSMLTDMVTASIGQRNYILTADRDEHIRVSRGLPQAHIIEGFCFGHESFVSKLCITTSGLLVSGGGDSNLFVWDWSCYRLRSQLALQHAVRDMYQNRRKSDVETDVAQHAFKIAVSGIWNVPVHEGADDEILVACEGIPALFYFVLGGAPAIKTVISVDGNVLDVTILDYNGRMAAIVSLDHLHEAGSNTKLRVVEAASRIHCISRDSNSQWVEDDEIRNALDWMNCQATASHESKETRDNRASKVISTQPTAIDMKAYFGMLYSIENLRKRPGAEE